MGKVQALRLRRTHDIKYSLDQFLGPDIDQTGFCLEGWVNFAPMDDRARVYPEANYTGKPLLLKPGVYPKLAGKHFRELRMGDKPITEDSVTVTLASLDLPEGVEAVFFSAPNFGGEAYPYRDDEHTIAGGEKKIASALVLDRRHRQQSHVVLFAQPAYGGQAQVLQVPHSWSLDIPSEEDTGSTELKPTIPFSSFHQSQDISSVGSAWVPPGIALDLLSIVKAKPSVFELIKGSELKMTYQSQRDPENPVECVPQSWYQDVPAFQEVTIPEGLVLFLFENEVFGGRYRILSAGTHQEMAKNQWTTHSAVLAVAPHGAEGALVLGPVPQVIPPDHTLPVWEKKDQEFAEFWFPNGFALMAGTEGTPGRTVTRLQGG
ncbi:MAG: hypothetical protein KDC54_05020, partial [Lewinella sp.]|nr:hypothetical protein [Lewinella sp.]